MSAVLGRGTAASIATIRDGLDLLWEPGGTYELRALKTRRGTVRGYFDDPDAFARDAARWSGHATGVYMTLNPVSPDLLARAHNRCEEFAQGATEDGDVLRRRWLPLDFDPVRKSGISANDREHAAGLLRARDAGMWLIARGISRDSIVFADSGNGGHLLLRVDLPNDEAARQLVQRVVNTVAFHLSDESVTVDLKTVNAARIWKIYGTLACKGDEIEDRRHRMASVLQRPAA